MVGDVGCGVSTLDEGGVVTLGVGCVDCGCAFGKDWVVPLGAGCVAFCMLDFGVCSVWVESDVDTFSVLDFDACSGLAVWFLFCVHCLRCRCDCACWYVYLC